MCTHRILAQNVSNMASRQKRSKVWLYFTKKDKTRASCNACRAVITSKGGNTSNMLKHLTTQHAITLYECKVFDTLLSDGGDSRGGAGGTASYVSKVPGNVKLPGPVDCGRVLNSHFSVFCLAHQPHVFLTLKKIYKFLWRAAIAMEKTGNKHVSHESKQSSYSCCRRDVTHA